MSEELILESKVGKAALSIFLYCIQNAIFSYDILKEKEIKGFIPNADDTGFILSNFEDIPLLAGNFSKYKKAIECTLNTNKTKDLLIQTNTIPRICQNYH